MVGVGLSSFILAAVLSTFLFLGRSGANVINYNEMESEARSSLELFAQDTRQASSITWISNNELSLTVNSAAIIYKYASGEFTRHDTSKPTVAGQNPRVLIDGVTPPVPRTSDADVTCTPFFRAYDITGAQIKAVEYASPTAATLTAASKTTKQLQISLEAQRNTRTVAAATNLVLSARFILRNKRITA
jgi:Tfp pilus assembly protein PilW